MPLVNTLRTGTHRRPGCWDGVASADDLPGCWQNLCSIAWVAFRPEFQAEIDERG